MLTSGVSYKKRVRDTCPSKRPFQLDLILLFVPSLILTLFTYYVEILNCVLRVGSNLNCVPPVWVLPISSQGIRQAILSFLKKLSMYLQWSDLNLCWFLHHSNNFRRNLQLYLNWPKNNVLVTPELWWIHRTSNKCLITMSKKENYLLALLINSLLVTYCCPKQDGQPSGTLVQPRANILRSVIMLEDINYKKMKIWN